jgi:folate-binding protein YgfZ
MPDLTSAIGFRPRAFVRVQGPDAADFLERMLSNKVAGLAPGASCEALLLTPKARVIAPLRVLRRSETDFLLLTEPELGAVVRENLLRARFAAKIEIEPEEHTSYVLLGPGDGIRNDEYGVPAVEVLDSEPPEGLPVLGGDELELMRIRAATPRFGAEIDDRVMPAEAGLVARAVSLDKGCFPGQEPIARLHYRGHANRALRIVELETDEPPAYDTEISLDGKAVGRITSAQRSNGQVLALAFVRVEVPDDAELAVGDVPAHLH